MPGVDQEILDVSIENLILDASTRGRGGLDTDITKAITDGFIEESMVGASDLKLTVMDRDLTALNSGVFKNRVRVTLDTVPFQLTELSLVDTDTLELSFEHWLIAEMREHTKPIRANRNTTTRAEFIHRQLKELKQAFVFICPDLDRKQAVEAPHQEEIQGQIQSIESTEESGRHAHVSHHRLTVKHVAMTQAQAAVISTGLNQASTLGSSKLAAEALVVALIQEADALNPPSGDKDSTGSLQVRASTAAGITATSGHGHLDPMNVAEVCAHFLTAGYYGKGGANALARAHPHWTPGEIAQACQGSAFPSAYDQWKDEAKAIVTDYEGGAGGFIEKEAPEPATQTSQYEFTRGKPGEREDTFTCSMRLAEEVLWRFFVVGRPRSKPAVYFIDDDRLIRSKPRYLIDPTTAGVKRLTFDHELGKRLVTMRGRKVAKPSEAQLEARLDRWEAPPGTVIELADYGEADGRWLVDSIQRSLFDAAGTIHLRAPQKAQQEPRSSPTSVNPEATTGPHAKATAGEKKKLAAEHPELKTGIREVVATILSHFPKLTITSTTGGSHAPNSYHYLGRAADLASGSQSYMDEAAEWVAKNLESVLTEGIHNPGLSVKDGKKVDPSFWGATTWAGHRDHLHVSV